MIFTNNTIKPVSLLCCTVSLFLTSIFTFSQSIEKTEINGKAYYVYPYKLSVNMHSDYEFAFRKKERIKLNINKYGNNFFSEFDYELTNRQMRKFNRLMGEYQREGEKRKFLNKRFAKSVRKNPYPLLDQNYQLNNDIFPSLDPIPDGDYVQFFENYYLVNEKGKGVLIANKVAAYFTIQNNLLEGKAIWLNIKGDTLKKGSFKNGMKEGEWTLIKHSIGYSIDISDAHSYIEKGHPYVDTMYTRMNYKNGAANGKYEFFINSMYPIEQGEYVDGDKSGEWLCREVDFVTLGNHTYRNRDNNLVTKRMKYASTDTIISHRPWIRDGEIATASADFELFDFYAKYKLTMPSSQLFYFAWSRDDEQDLDLEEELAIPEVDEYEMYDDEYNYEEYAYADDYVFSNYQSLIFDQVEKKYLKRGKVIDSLGYISVYDGVLEEHYPNGQLAYRYQFENGHLKSEDTIFWDNGIAHDVIIQLTDSNQYLRSIYDYSGKLFKQLKYDSLGDFIRVSFAHESMKYVNIEGLKADNPKYGQIYFYKNYDTLKNELNNDVVIYRSWNKIDSTRLFNVEYDPLDRSLNIERYAVTGNIPASMRINFSENFESWTGNAYSKLGGLELETVSSAALYHGMEKDSIPQRNVRFAYQYYDIASDNLIKKNGIAYSGEVSIQFDKPNFSVSKSGLKIKLPAPRKMQRKLYRDIYKFKYKGRLKNIDLLNYSDAVEYPSDLGIRIFTDFFRESLGEYFDNSWDTGYNEFHNEGKHKKYRSNGIKELKGPMLEGKPHGTWYAINGKNEIMAEVPFTKGVAHGKAMYYNQAYPISKEEEWYWMDDPLRDSFPTKKTKFLETTIEYKNGKMNGPRTTYTWHGTVSRQETYKDGYQHGPAYERNKLAHTKLNYEDGVLDGYVKTFLTVNKRDSILLYDLNFQNGQLQGESRAFHTNGKIAKRGFFLNGEPIEDYVAYDSLGFKYHYVKFKYSFPIEEKIWEENALSVRYQFNWRDSIFFEPVDIASSQSLETTLYQLGFGRESLYQPYYGRPRLVNKRDVKYRMTKYFPSDTISRDGFMEKGKKVECWSYYNYLGKLVCEVNYKDSVIKLNDSIRFRSKGIYTLYDDNGRALHKSFMIEKFEKYDCSHTDHYEIRQFYTFWEASDSLGRMNGYVKNYYDNGVLQSEGLMKNGLPEGIWKYFDPYGNLNQAGVYVSGKRNGRWLSGDLSKTKYLGDICLNPNLPDLEQEIKYRENLLDITVTTYKLGKSLNKQYYDINMNEVESTQDEQNFENEISE